MTFFFSVENVETDHKKLLSVWMCVIIEGKLCGERPVQWTWCFYKVGDQFDSDFKKGIGQSYLSNTLGISMILILVRKRFYMSLRGKCMEEQGLCKLAPLLNNNYKRTPAARIIQREPLPGPPLCHSSSGPSAGPWEHRDIEPPSAMPLSVYLHLSFLDHYLLYSTSLGTWSPSSESQNPEPHLPMSNPRPHTFPHGQTPHPKIPFFPISAHHICTSGCQLLGSQ